jgi:hypothetical protein
LVWLQDKTGHGNLVASDLKKKLPAPAPYFTNNKGFPHPRPDVPWSIGPMVHRPHGPSAPGGMPHCKLQGNFLLSSPLWDLGETSYVCRIGWELFLFEFTSCGNFSVPILTGKIGRKGAKFLLIERFALIHNACDIFRFLLTNLQKYLLRSEILFFRKLFIDSI